ncbi:hypothetical protein BH09BAC5_BH09BAC5_22800 [soil metagenome]
MKKNLLFSFTAILSVTFLTAQVALTNPVHGISVGNINNSYAADTVGVQAGSAGTSQTWNMSNLVIGSTLYTATYVTPASTPYGSSFSTSNLAVSDGSGTYGYYITGSTSLSLSGVANASTTIPYQNTEVSMVYPFGYSSNITDNFSSTYVSNSINVIRTGTIAVSADGTGTLILPSGSYNVLRVKTVQLFTDSFVGLYSAQYNFVTYAWYSGTERFPLVNFNQMSITLMSSTTYSESVQVNSQVVMGIENAGKPTVDLNLFPNPATDHAQLNFSVTENQSIAIQVTDLSGRIVSTIERGEINTGNYTETIDVSTLPKGIYLVNILGEKSIATQKLIVQ